MVICLERCADLHMAELMPLPLTVFCFSKIQIGFTFLVPAHLGVVPDKGLLNGCVCVCVCVCVLIYTVVGFCVYVQVLHRLCKSRTDGSFLRRSSQSCQLHTVHCRADACTQGMSQHYLCYACSSCHVRVHITCCSVSFSRSVLFLSHPRSERWPHLGCTFSIYLCPLSL